MWSAGWDLTADSDASDRFAMKPRDVFKNGYQNRLEVWLGLEEKLVLG